MAKYQELLEKNGIVTPKKVLNFNQRVSLEAQTYFKPLQSYLLWLVSMPNCGLKCEFCRENDNGKSIDLIFKFDIVTEQKTLRHFLFICVHVNYTTTTTSEEETNSWQKNVVSEIEQVSCSVEFSENGNEIFTDLVLSNKQLGQETNDWLTEIARETVYRFCESE